MFSQIRCVAFDAVGTLIFPDPPVGEAYARIGRKYGSRLSAEEVRGRFREAFCAHFGGEERTTSEAGERRAWRSIVGRIFDDIDDIESCFEELFSHFGRAESWQCFPDVADTLPELARRGYHLAIASNFDRRLHPICRGHEELRVFSSIVISSEVGTNKPAAGYFQALVETTGFEKHEVLLVGDDWRNDIEGPRAFGMKAVFLDRSQPAAVSQKDNITVINSLAGLLELLP